MDGNFCSVVFLPILFLSEKKTKERKRIWNGHNEQEGGDEAEIDTENHGKREREVKRRKRPNALAHLIYALTECIQLLGWHFYDSRWKYTNLREAQKGSRFVTFSKICGKFVICAKFQREDEKYAWGNKRHRLHSDALIEWKA